MHYTFSENNFLLVVRYAYQKIRKMKWVIDDEPSLKKSSFSSSDKKKFVEFLIMQLNSKHHFTSDRGMLLTSPEYFICVMCKRMFHNNNFHRCTSRTSQVHVTRTKNGRYKVQPFKLGVDCLHSSCTYNLICRYFDGFVELIEIHF